MNHELFINIICSHSLFFVSMQMVTGPSFSSSTFISAPNSPAATGFPSCSSTTSRNRSYSGTVTSWLPALRYHGLFPFL